MLGSWGIILIKMETTRVMVQGTQIHAPLTGSELGVTGHHPHNLPPPSLYATHHPQPPAPPSPRSELPSVFPACPPEMSVNIPNKQVPFLTSSRISPAHSLMGREPQLPGPAANRHSLRATAFTSKLNNPLLLSPTGLSKAVILHLFFLSL